MITQSSEALIGLSLVVGLAGLYEAAEPTSIRVLARRLALGHLLRVAEDGQVLCDGIYIYIYQHDAVDCNRPM